MNERKIKTTVLSPDGVTGPGFTFPPDTTRNLENIYEKRFSDIGQQAV